MTKPEMFQTFETSSDRHHTAERLKALRAEMKAFGLDAFLIPRADEHQGEYVEPRAERLKWLTGFSGSAGLAAVTLRSAALFVDGRYDVQVRLQTDDTLFDYPGIAGKHLAEWLTKSLNKGAVIGFDPWLMTVAGYKALSQKLENSTLKLKPLPRNPVDKIWGNSRPEPSSSPVTLHPLQFSGRKTEDKLDDTRQEIRNAKVDYAVLTAPDSIAWLFNIRGSDVAHNPVVLSFALVPAKGKAELFIDRSKLTKSIETSLKRHAKILPPDSLRARLKHFKQTGKLALLDPATAAFWFHRVLGGTKSYRTGTDPCVLLKAVKNTTEIKGVRAAHQRDGVAVTCFLCWLDQEAAKGDVDEIGAVRQLETCRAETQALKEISFDTIAGSGPNGAIVHYRVDEKSNRRLRKGELFLIDSGAQYADGTTDITRTVAIGSPAKEMCRHFTLVLKGHIAIATARFPEGSRGIDLDPFARRALWQHGLDFAHGTGHGVGSYLCVHEGPASISRAGMAELKAGMILSNEPGYYKEGAYGIRIENLVLVTEAEEIPGGDKPMHALETLTLAPIDRRLIAKELLTEDELHWLNTYHRVVREALSRDLSPAERQWLNDATKPL